MQRGRGSCPSWSSSREVEGMLCPPLPCCPPTHTHSCSPLRFSLCRAEGSLQAAPARAQHIPLTRAEASTQSPGTCGYRRICSPRDQEHPEREPEIELSSVAQIDQVEYNQCWELSDPFLPVPFTGGAQPCLSRQSFSHKN